MVILLKLLHPKSQNSDVRGLTVLKQAKQKAQFNPIDDKKLKRLTIE